MIEIVPYRPEWVEEFARLGTTIRSALGDLALAIHHIGSTSVPGIAAKDVVDIQLTVADLDAPIEGPLRTAGFVVREGVFRDHCPPGMALDPAELEKRYYRHSERAVHLHVREVGRFNQRYPLLCRDYLRSHPFAAAAYAEIKRQLARRFSNDEEAYYDIKDPVFDVLMAGAEEWVLRVGWTLPPTDA